MPPRSFLPAGDPLAYVHFAFTHRFVTATHVQRAFNLNSYRTAQHQVTQLARQGLLADVPVYRTLNSFPNVYVATGRGVNRVAQAFERTTGRRWQFGSAEQRRRGRPRRHTFIEHELDCTDVDIVLQRLAARRDDVSLVHVQRRYDRRGRGLRHLDENGERRTVVPDAGYHFIRRRPGQRWLDLCFLEMDRGSMAWTTRMVEKFAAYEAWASSSSGQSYLLDQQRVFGDWQARVGTFRLLIVSRARRGEGSDTDRLAKLVMAALPLSHAMHRRLWLTTWEALAPPSGTAKLNAPIWLWGKDVSSWRSNYNAEAHHIPDTMIGKRERRALVREHVVNMPRRRLFKETDAHAWYPDQKPHEREQLEPDNSVMLPPWDVEGTRVSVGEWRCSDGRPAPSS